MGYPEAVRVCRQCFPDASEAAAKQAEIVFEASTASRKKEFMRKKAEERRASRARAEEIRQKYARAPAKKKRSSLFS